MCADISSEALLLISQKIANEGVFIGIRELLKILADSMNIERICLWQIDSQHISIVDGLPPEKHGIGKRDLLSNHKDIKDFLDTGREVYLNDDPRNSPLTEYFRPTIIGENINAVLYVKNRDKIVVFDARDEKMTFWPDDILLSVRLTRLLVARTIGYNEFLASFRELNRQIDYQELRDKELNGFTNLRLNLRHLIKNLKALTDGRDENDSVTICSLKELLREIGEFDEMNKKVTKELPYLPLSAVRT